MKKFVSALLAICISLSMFAFSAAATEETVTAGTTSAEITGPTVVVDSVDAPRGESVTVNATLKNNPGINYFKFKIYYDNTVLVMTSIKGLPGSVSGQSIDLMPQIMTYAQAGNVTDEELVLFTMTFDVSETAVLGSTTDIRITLEECYNEDDDEIQLDTVAGALTIICDHSYEGVVTAPATYSHSGTKTYTCTKCGDKYDEELSQLVPTASSPKIELTPSGVTAAGKTVTVDVNIKNNPGFDYLKVKIDYPTDSLELVDCTSALGATFQKSQTIDTVPYAFVIANTTDFTDDCTVATLTFNVLSGVADGKIVISVEDFESFNEKDEYVVYYTPAGEIEVKNFTYGDCNNDGKVKGNDATLLMKYLAEWDVDITLEAADCNGDGKVKGNDATLLMKYLAEWDVTLGPQS